MKLKTSIISIALGAALVALGVCTLVRIPLGSSRAGAGSRIIDQRSGCDFSLSDLFQVV